ncbi:MAM domain-containing glycosylphosphatidylinositol anchor protein 1-like isoform X2 [Hydractinia symbiolongicarpus]|uniref:MAM domain-containing glycosylphosphatidylinositol anchor protein 1-like isoform X2 n=1 Tax=Hydractinia symbiolongicarpus TaxID=13093 RepID=UPI00254A4970|nr:MAM domain-containing glycosylphosphatidylinositol anchor protein 1-like isoform X2 [Hydractinia symbiolongicarpus]
MNLKISHFIKSQFKKKNKMTSIKIILVNLVFGVNIIAVKLKVTVGGTYQIEGGDTNITCHVGGGEAVKSFSWKVDGEAIEETSNRIQVKNVTRQMEGRVYGCSATSFSNETTDFDFANMVVYFTAVPNFILYDPFPEEESGSLLVGDCFADSNPVVAAIIWYKDGQVIKDQTTNTLRVKSSRTNSGYYSCGKRSAYAGLKNSTSKKVTFVYMDSPTITFAAGKLSPAREGDDIQMNCSVKEYYPGMNLTYQWLKFNPDYGTNTVLKNNGTIFLIRSSTVKNSGKYSCKVVGQAKGKVIVKKTHQEVLVYAKSDAPLLSTTKSNLNSGETFTLTCVKSSNANGTVLYQFFKDGRNITTLQTDHKLTAVNIKTKESGAYRCSENMKNSLKFSNTIEINVQLHVRVLLYSTKEWSNVNISCFIYGGENVSSVTWKRDGQVLPESKTYVTLKNISRAMQGQNYSCSATTLSGKNSKESSSLLTMYWFDQPKAVLKSDLYLKEGATLHLRCESDMYPNDFVTYTWYKDGMVIRNASKVYLRQKNVMKKDGGNYSCGILHPFTNGDKNSTLQEVNIIYMYSPSINITQKPPFKAGSNIELNCGVMDYFPDLNITYRWLVPNKFNSQTLIGEEKKLVLKDISKDNTARYICQATGRFNGSVIPKESSLHIEVSYKAEGVMFSPRNSTQKYKIGVSLSVKCSLSDYGIPPSTLYWYRNKRPITVNTEGNSLYLNISSVKAKDTGNYTCEATNNVGNISKVLTIFVMETPGRPQMLQLVSKTSHSIQVRWKAPVTDGYSPITSYKVYHKENSTTSFIKNTVNDSLKFNITNLKPGMFYDVKVQAGNSIGFGQETAVVTLTTNETAPEPVNNISIITSQQHIIVRFSSSQSINGILKGYTVFYRRLSSNKLLQAAFISQPPISDVNITGLELYTEYEVLVMVSNTLFNTTSNKTVRTLGTAPKPLDKELPKPSEDERKETSFAINIVLFEKTVGEIAHYDVIVFKKTATMKKSPNEYRNDEITFNVVGRLYNPKDNELFVVGDSNTGNRIKRQLGAPKNPPLEKNTEYVVFVRAYVSEAVYQSSPWYPSVTTKGGDDDDDDSKKTKIVVVIVVCILLAIVILGVVLFYFYRDRIKRNNNINISRGSKKKYKSEQGEEIKMNPATS